MALLRGSGGTFAGWTGVVGCCMTVEETVKAETRLPRVDLGRLQADLKELSQFGLDEETHGIYRMAFTDADIAARKWLMAEMERTGMRVRMDGAGNVIGRLEAAAGDAPPLVLGSHTDTVPCGGHLDGSLGVMIGLECARVLAERDTPLLRPLEVIAFSDEEGRFGGMFGSQAFVGDVTPEFLYQSQDLAGVSLHEAMEEQGLEPMEALNARRAPGDIAAYLEVHIEQGPVLAASGSRCGIVDHITGLFRWHARLLGSPNHAGTTPMEMRQDAFLGLAEFANEIPRVLEENGSDRSRATVGNVALLPGSANTIPGTAEFSLDVRDTAPEILEALSDAFRKALSAIARRRRLRFEFEEVSRIEPVACDSKLVDLLQTEADRLGLAWELLPSGAAHDAQMVARIAPVAMVFVPSREGRSHSPAEWSAWDDIEAAANLALNTAVRILEQL